MAMEKNNSFLPEKLVEALALFWRSRTILIIAMLIPTLLSIGIVLLLPKTYRATTVLLPQTDDAQLGGLNGVSGLAAMAGLQVGKIQLEQMFPEMVSSERILSKVIYKKYQTAKYDSAVNLIEYWKINEQSERRNLEVAMDQLSKGLEVTVERRTNIVTITLVMTDPRLAADVVNTVTEELDYFLRTQRITSASEQRKWIETRLNEVKSDLAGSEDRLKNFSMKNRIISQSPELLLTQQRMLREVEMNSAIFAELRKQQELARINEIKNIPVISVMDYAVPPAKKEGPQRIIIVFSTCMFSFLLAAAFVYVRAYYHGEVAATIARVRSIFQPKKVYIN